MARQWQCGCGQPGAHPAAWVSGPDGAVAFVLCERCVRFPEKRLYLSGMVARRAFGPGVVLRWREADGEREARADTPDALARFRAYSPPRQAFALRA